MHTPRTTTFVDRLLGSRYFLFALLLHLIVFLMVATIVIFPNLIKPPEDVPTVTIAPEGPIVEPIPQRDPTPADSGSPIPQATGPTDTSKNNMVIQVPTPTTGGFQLPSGPSAPSPKVIGDPPFSTSTISGSDRASELEKTGEIWLDRTNPTHYKFNIYLARYAQGDWETTVSMKGDEIAGGSLANLAAALPHLTHDKLHADLVMVPLVLSSPEILDTRPPFIFFTGHKNFVLTDEEVSNLRKYLWLGGAIWGDNGLAGRGSRFDVAFRREMKRVLSSKDQDWKTLPDSHPIFANGYFPMREIPTGMNFYNEPIEAMSLEGKLAVIYTLNDYSDMLRMTFRPDMITPDLEQRADHEFVTPGELWNYRTVYYRNFTPESCAQSYKLSANIVSYLLTRFKDMTF